MLMRVRIAMVCGVGLAIFNGMNVEARALDPIAPEEMIARLQEFNYEPWNGTASEVDRTNENGCQQSKVKLEVRDPVTAVVHPVALTIFLFPKGRGEPELDVPVAGPSQQQAR